MDEGQRIVIDGRMLMPQMTGVGRYLLGLATGLSQLQSEHHYELWLQAGLPAEHPVWALSSRGITLRQLPIRHMDLRGQWVLPAQLWRQSPDLLHYPHFDLPWLAPGRVVATIHDLKYIAHPGFFPQVSRLKRLVMLLMMRFTVHRARHVIAVSHNTRQDIIQRLGLPESKITVIPEGVNMDDYQAPPPARIEALRQRYRLGEHYILFVGERRPHKNLTGLLKAFVAFQAMVGHSYQLIIAGKTYSDYQEPERLAESLGLQDRVCFIGSPPDSDLPLLYHSADAFCLFSFYEGFGLPVLEAMASGTPVVAASLTSLPEVVGEAGLLVPPDQPEQAALALTQLVPGGQLRQQCIERGLERARQFTWLSCARQTLDVYLEAIRS